MTLSSGDQPHYSALLTRLREVAGLQFDQNRQPEMERAAGRAMLEAGASSLGDYVARLADGRVSVSALIDEVTIGETYFFREPEQFAYVRDVVMPEIAARRGAHVRLWSAGCSSGEEPYSLAILLTELGLGRSAYILGTDISTRALASARRGEYQRWSLRGPGAARARRHLVEKDARFTLDAAIRGRVQLRQLNLADPSYPSPHIGIHDFDLILCRNVLIYFDRPTIARVAQRLYSSLSEGGWLIAASSDPPLAELAPFVVVATERGVFYRKQTRSVPGEDPARATAASFPVALAAPPAESAPVSSERPARVELPEPPDGVVREERARALANAGDLVRAAELAKEGTRLAPLDPGMAFLYAAVLIELGRDEEAIAALRRALYLDATLIAAHLSLGMVLRRLHDDRGAMRSFQTVLRLCAAVDPATILPLADGACAGHVAAIARAQLLPAPRADEHD